MEFIRVILFFFFFFFPLDSALWQGLWVLIASMRRFLEGAHSPCFFFFFFFFLGGGGGGRVGGGGGGGGDREGGAKKREKKKRKKKIIYIYHNFSNEIFFFFFFFFTAVRFAIFLHRRVNVIYKIKKNKKIKNKNKKINRTEWILLRLLKCESACVKVV